MELTKGREYDFANKISNYFKPYLLQILHWLVFSLLKFKNKPYKFLFVMGHIRSGSSLLMHILATNPEIIGYGRLQ